MAKEDSKKAKPALASKAEAPKAKPALAPKKAEASAKPAAKAKSDVKAPAAKAAPVKAGKAPAIDPKVEAKFVAAYGSVELKIEKIKQADDIITVTLGDTLTTKQFAKVKSVAGKKGELTQRGSTWVITYA